MTQLAEIQLSVVAIFTEDDNSLYISQDCTERSLAVRSWKEHGEQAVL
jgi:hypothetical protein